MKYSDKLLLKETMRKLQLLPEIEPEIGSGVCSVVQRNKLVANHFWELTAENLSMSL